MNPSELQKRISEFPYWYHRIELAPGIVTPGFPLEPLWDNLRKVRNLVDYHGKRILDVASFDGMFSFEAEQRGARTVVAADCLYRSFANLLFCREVLGSKVIPYYNISPYELSNRLDVFLEENYDSEQANERLFDVVQHFGLLYHLRDPMHSLAQARSVLRPDGVLIIETDVVLDSDESHLVFNGMPKHARLRDNYSVWWAPTRECLFDMLEATLFEVDRSSYSEIPFDTPASNTGKLSTDDRDPSRVERRYSMGRCAVLAYAKKQGQGNEKFERELFRTYRNPGLDIRRFLRADAL